jgi:hypothetical protein
MQQNRKRDKDVPSRASNTEQAKGSQERMTNRDPSDADLGTSTDRAMYDDEGESRLKEKDRSGERGLGDSSERNRGSSDDNIGNRAPDRGRKQQDQLPDPGRSQSER